MDKILAIKGHPTRGKEVLEILEMLGNKNDRWDGNNTNFIYYSKPYCNYILAKDIKDCNLTEFTIFTLEEFLEKYPYKIGDKVQDKGSESYEDVYIIEVMVWENNQINYIVYNQSYKYPKGTVTAEHLQSYKEDGDINQENENETTEINYKINLNNPCFDGYNKIELTLPDNWKFKQKDNKIFGVRKQYPKTYEECKLLLQTNYMIPSKPGYREYKIALFQELLICRDAYWKIIGKEMGLSGSWNPDWTKANERKYCIVNTEGNITKWVQKTTNKILAFPTEEMRDVFFENFKDTIEGCKEFL